MEENLSFDFCGGCGGEYIRPDAGRVVIRDGKPVCLCPDCADRPDTGLFEKRYRKFVDKMTGRG